MAVPGWSYCSCGGLSKGLTALEFRDEATNDLLELLEKMNIRVAEEYKGFGDVASGVRVFVEQLKSKSGNFDEYVQQIDVIEKQYDNLISRNIKILNMSSILDINARLIRL
ncbi:hypothetical protein RJ639_039788 [Escallonia herrerae]|uniref:Biogenesis of lysosome-related organelles complex 1 subunit 2 n=1 Tax=Escallonia herrerae TaxID=1293975 RepID=A0AA88WMB0_9ASTE|nr:hypothetical protein RJ639_039788 [Escallonia herrerae]